MGERVEWESGALLQASIHSQPILEVEGSLFFIRFMLSNDQIGHSTIALQVKRGGKEGTYENKMEWTCQFYHHGL
jgi:hypothetical protein